MTKYVFCRVAEVLTECLASSLHSSAGAQELPMGHANSKQLNQAGAGILQAIREGDELTFLQVQPVLSLTGLSKGCLLLM